MGDKCSRSSKQRIFRLGSASLRMASKAKIIARIRRLGMGNAGDVAPVGDGISEMRIHSGPGYRVYYKQTDKTVVLILLGGDKSTQARDIETAKAIAAEF